MEKFKKTLYGINLPDFERQININYLNQKELDCKILEDGIILPLRKTEIPAQSAIYEGGVCDNKFNFLAGYKRIDNGKFNNWEIVRSYKPDVNVENSNDSAVFAGIAFRLFGHFLIESFSRLWWVAKNIDKLSNTKIVFLKESDFDTVFYCKLLNCLGISNEQIVFLDKPMKFKTIYIPEQSVCFASYYHKEYTIPYEVIVSRLPASLNDNSIDRVYLSRTQFEKRDLINEEYFEDFYRKKGYKIVYPEKLSIEEQISIIANANEIVSPVGTLSHLALFAKRGARLVSLMRSRSSYNIPQGIINQAKELEHTLIDVTCNFLPNRYSSSCYYIGPTHNWKEFVSDYFNEDIKYNLAEYLNSENSRMGDYFKLWIKTFGQPAQMNKIYNDNPTKILDTLENAFVDESTPYLNLAKKYSPPKLSLNINDKIISVFKGKVFESSSTYNNEQLNELVKGKIFKFSRPDGSYMRLIVLNDDGTIHTINGKNHKNESFWKVEGGQLYFLNDNANITGRYFYFEIINNGLEINGYYEPNPSILFKLKEVIV